MARNVEIKAHLRDADTIKSRVLDIKDLGDITVIGDILQHDIFYRANYGRLKLRIFENNTGELIAYDRENSSGPKLSTYNKIKVEFPHLLDAALRRSLGELGKVKKDRYVYIIGQTRVHIDSVLDLGNFIELEVVLNESQTLEEGQKIAEKIMKRLNIEQKDLIDVAYLDLLLAKK